MALKFKFKSKDEIPAEHAGLYVERDGAFVLDAEGAVEKAKLDEFRTNRQGILLSPSCHLHSRACRQGLGWVVCGHG